MNESQQVNARGALGISAAITVIFTTIMVMLNAAEKKESQVVPTTTLPNTPTIEPTTMVTSTILPSVTTAVNKNTLKDGTYTTTVSYRVPHAIESITVTVTFKNGIIESVKNAHFANEPESEMYQNWFEAEYKPLVVGKTPESVSLSRIGGASITTTAFNQAIAKLTTQAQQ